MGRVRHEFGSLLVSAGEDARVLLLVYEDEGEVGDPIDLLHSGNIALLWWEGRRSDPSPDAENGVPFGELQVEGDVRFFAGHPRRQAPTRESLREVVDGVRSVVVKSAEAALPGNDAAPAAGANAV